jgi:preprotein translocase subunit YajC
MGNFIFELTFCLIIIVVVFFGFIFRQIAKQKYHEKQKREWDEFRDKMAEKRKEDLEGRN